LVFIGLDRFSARVGRFVRNEPDFRLTHDDMGGLCGTNRVHGALPSGVPPFCRDSFMVS
jgi:hypothetical protein